MSLKVWWKKSVVSIHRIFDEPGLSGHVFQYTANSVPYDKILESFGVIWYQAMAISVQKNEPIVSVVIPSYNRPDLVICAIGSVICQTYRNLEIIVVDDGSALPLEAIIKEKYGEKVYCLRNEVSLGAPAARNAGAMIAKGEYIAFLDDDDLWLPEKLQKQMNAFGALSDDFGIVYCGFDYILFDKIVAKDTHYHTVFDLSVKALEECPIGSPTPLIRNKFFDMVGGFDNSLPSCQDWDLWIRLSKVCKFFPVEESLALYRIHGEQISTDIHKKIEARKMILSRYFSEIRKYPRILASHYFRLGSLSVIVRNDSDARKFYYKSLSSNFNFICIVHLILQIVCRPLERLLTEYFGINRINGIRVIN